MEKSLRFLLILFFYTAFEPVVAGRIDVTDHLRSSITSLTDTVPHVIIKNGKFQIEDLYNQKPFQMYRQNDTTFIGGLNSIFEYTSPIKLHHDAATNSFIMFPDKLQLNQPVELAGGNSMLPPLRIKNSDSLLHSPQAGAIENDGAHLYYTDSSGKRVQLDNADKLQLDNIDKLQMGQLRFTPDSLLDQKIIFSSTPESNNGNAGIFWGQYRVNTTGPDTSNNVLSMGINWDQSRGTQEYIRLGMESHYENFGQPAWQEWHAPEIRTQDGTIFRPSSWIGPKGYPVGSWLYRAESLTWMNSIGTRQLFGFTEGGNFFSNVYGWPAATWRFNVFDNQTDEFRYGFQWQIAQSGEAILGGNITAFSFSNPVIINANSAYALMNILNTDHANGLYANGTQNNLYLAQGNFNASEFAYLNLTNTNTETGSSVLQLQTHMASTGSPYIEFYVYGGKQWRVGIDNVDQQHFKIGVNDWSIPMMQLNGNNGQLTLHPLQYSTNGEEQMLTVKDGVVSTKPITGAMQFFDLVYKDSISNADSSPLCISNIPIENQTAGTLTYEVIGHTWNGDIAAYSRKVRFKRVDGNITLMEEQEVVADQKDASLSSCIVTAIVQGDTICIQASGLTQNISFRMNAGINYHHLFVFNP